MNLTLEQFEKLWMGKVIRDGQCVSLFREYMQTCHGIPHTGSVEGAVDLWTKFDKFPSMGKYFTQIGEVDLRVGDAVVFSATEQNKYGHVAIVTELHADGMNVIEQDGFKLNGMKPGFWTYKRFLGALRAKEPAEWGV